MKKGAILTILSLLITTLFIGLFSINKNVVLAESDNLFESEYFMPSSPIEFYDLQSPIAISYSSDGFLIVSEYAQSSEFPQDDTKSFNRLTIFNPKFGYKTINGYGVLNGHKSIFSINQVKKYGDYVYYLSGSIIYRLNVNNLDAEPENTQITSSTFFDFYDKTLITNSNNDIKLYSVIEENGDVKFTLNENLSFFTGKTTLGIITENSVIYYYDSNVNTLFSYNDGSQTKKEIAVINSINHFTKLGDYIYYTSINEGLFRIDLKNLNKIEKILNVDVNLTTLGGLNTPQGLAVKGNNLLIADSSLNAIQEIDGTTNDFTTFAITTESTANFRLTYNASNIYLSENYLYVLDNSNVSTDSSLTKKRIIRTYTNQSKKTYTKLDLTKFYEEDDNFDVVSFVASDEYLLIFTGEKLILFEIDNDELFLRFSINDTSITSTTYLDGSFYYTNNSIKDNKSLININKIEVPSKNNNLSDINVEKINEGFETEGTCEKMTVDIFGNIYMVVKNADKTLLIRFFRQPNFITEISSEVVSIQTDFSGNVYLLNADNSIRKYTSSNGNVSYKDFKISSNDLIKDFAITYRHDNAFILSKGYVLKTINNSLEIQNMSKISANLVDNEGLLENPKFVYVSKGVKMFKVETTNFNVENGNKYFKEITPITNPNTENVYIVISELEDYYLVSCSQDFVALVRKTSVDYDYSFNSDASLISREDYEKYGIEITDLNKTKIISNDTFVFSKPIYNKIYNVNSLQKSTSVYAVKQIKFNNQTLTLVSTNENSNPIGFVVNGYLIDNELEDVNYLDESKTIIGGEYKKKITTSIMIALIALTITLTALFIEYKLLFKKDKP